MLEQRLGEAITATAGLIMGAWEQAGRPTRAEDPPEVRRVAPQKMAEFG